LAGSRTAYNRGGHDQGALKGHPEWSKKKVPGGCMSACGGEAEAKYKHRSGPYGGEDIKS